MVAPYSLLSIICVAFSTKRFLLSTFCSALFAQRFLLSAMHCHHWYSAEENKTATVT